MSIFRRLKNLWKLSEIERDFAVPANTKNMVIGLQPQKPHRMAEIIRRVPKDPIIEVVGEQKSPI